MRSGAPEAAVVLALLSWFTGDAFCLVAFGPEFATALTFHRTDVTEGNGHDRDLRVADPWGRPFRERWIEAGEIPPLPGVMSPRIMRLKPLIYSRGPNGKDEQGSGDDLLRPSGASDPMLLSAFAQVGRGLLFLAFLAAIMSASRRLRWQRFWLVAALIGGGVGLGLAALIPDRLLGIWSGSTTVGASTLVLGSSLAAAATALFSRQAVSCVSPSAEPEGESSDSA